MMLKKDVKEITQAIYHLERAIKFIEREDIQICTSRMYHAQSYYQAGNGVGLTPITKECGSDLVGVHDALKILKRLFDNQLPKQRSV